MDGRWRARWIAGRAIVILALAIGFGACAEGTGQASVGPTVVRTPTPPPTPRVTLTPIPVTKTELTARVARGGKATLSVKTLPLAECSIVVEYESGPSQASGLSTRTADAKGVAAWSWTVGRTTTPGSWPITVECSKDGHDGTLALTFDVTP
jgi:hypothetical protein